MIIFNLKANIKITKTQPDSEDFESIKPDKNGKFYKKNPKCKQDIINLVNTIEVSKK